MCVCGGGVMTGFIPMILMSISATLIRGMDSPFYMKSQHMYTHSSYVWFLRNGISVSQHYKHVRVETCWYR